MVKLDYKFNSFELQFSSRPDMESDITMTKIESGSTFANVDSVTFDLADCVLKINDDERRGWLNEEKAVAHLIRFTPRPPSWDFEVTDLGAAREFYAEQCSNNGGVMLSLENVETDGKAALVGLFKYRTKPGSLAMNYVGIIWIPFDDFTFQINVESMEMGTTGTREAAVMLLEGENWPTSNDPPILVKSADDLFARMGNSLVRELPSDQEKYDTKFPDHPLSKVRLRLQDVLRTLKFDERIKVK